MAAPDETSSALPADRLVRIIHFQNEIAKTRLNLDAVLRRTADLAQLLTRADGAVVELVDGADMVYRAATGLAEPSLGLRLPREGSFSGLCVASGEALRCTDSEEDSRVNLAACRAVGLRSMVVVPLQHESTCEGVLKVLSARPDAFDAADTQTLALIAASIAAALAHAGQHGSQIEEARAFYQLATRDRLTGLANRAYFEDHLRQVLAMARRSGQGFALLMLDMDGLKAINDTCGHLAGDEALCALARRLQAHTRESDVAARLGGDEFAVLLTSVRDRPGAVLASEKLAMGLDGPFRHEGREHPMGASVGLACYPEDGESAEALMAFADARMYEAKRARKAR